MVKPRSLDRVVAAAAEAAAEEAIDRRVDELTQEGSLDSVLQDIPGSPFRTPPAVDDLLSSVPTGEGYYMKLYREIHPGQFEYKLRIDDYSTWTDLESEISTIVQAYTRKDREKWGSGKYRIFVYKDGARGIYSKPIIMNVDARESDLPAPSKGNGVDAREKIAETASLIREVKDLMGGQTNPAEITKMMAESFKAGLGVVPKTESDGKDNFLKIVSLLKDLGLVGQSKEEKKVDPSQVMRDTITMLKDMGLIGSSKPKDEGSSLREAIVLLKDLGLVGQPPREETAKEDPYAMVEKVVNLMNLVKSIGGGGEGTGAAPSLGVELVRILGPRVPEMVERITGSVNNVAEVSKLKLERRIIGEDRGIRPLPPPLVAPPEQLPPSPTLEAIPMNPVVKEIYEAIESRNKEFYPRLKQLLDIYVGPHILPMIVSGQMAQEVLLNNLATSLQNPYFAEEKSRMYFSEFIASFAPVVDLSVPPEGGIVGRCSSCGTEYEFNSEESFEQDTKQCDNEGCGGVIDRVITGVA